MLRCTRTQYSVREWTPVMVSRVAPYRPAFWKLKNIVQAIKFLSRFWNYQIFEKCKVYTFQSDLDFGQSRPVRSGSSNSFTKWTQSNFLLITLHKIIRWWAKQTLLYKPLRLMTIQPVFHMISHRGSYMILLPMGFGRIPSQSKQTYFPWCIFLAWIHSGNKLKIWVSNTTHCS